MLNKILSLFSFLFLSLFAIVIIQSCANIASPTGGAYDVDPPVVRRATPGFNALNASPGRIEIEFDENIKIEKPNEKVIITPPQQNMPVIRSVGRKAIVELNDELLPNTTYTIDFTDAIVDNNEGNPIENFVYSFSTGDQLDTLSVSGKVVTAQDLEPVPGIYVGIHSNLDDTAFTKVPFQRISRTDSRGNFTVRGISPGEYKVYALNDLNRDYKYDNPQEAIAFLDSIIIPSAIRAERQDTVFVDSITIDTIRTVQYTRFLPDDLLLRTFLSDFQRQYLQKHERPEQNRLTLFFAAPTDRPTFSLLNPGVDGDDWYVAERSSRNDTLILWITDSLIYKQDSISMKINYIRTDSLNKDYIATDTLNFNIRKSIRGKRQESKGAEEEQALKFLGINSNVQSSFELYNPIRIEFAQPIVALDSSDVKLERAVDSLFEVVPYRMEHDSLNPRKFTLRPSWMPGESYRLTIDSAAIFSHYGIWNDKYEQLFTVKPLDQYGNLEISITGLPDGENAFVELLDNSDKPFRKSIVKEGKARFQDLLPGEIYARIVIDSNGDGVWTTGNYDDKRQPEELFYYPDKFQIRAFSDHSEEWNILSTPVVSQKPIEITKNKPEEKKKRRDPNQERERQQHSRQSSPFSGMGGLGGPSAIQQSGSMR
ncbi:Ig-like domain-containing protein [Proteiniphilum propionicum]|uniref:Ig-like domain-containing protein n=1 Tax=Proteiniphilum propionicum TaxID=2829812 RepID=UPI001EEA98D2|nr:Ig-like domain-containing protein [Proteiniphilum propionicum]ULB35255.1 Ig-like domain-containing protein [Proteiniphilum propionicum]